MKKLGILGLVVLLSACSTASTPTSTNGNNDGNAYCDEEVDTTCGFTKSADMSAYEGFDAKNSRFKESDMANVIKTFEAKKDGIFYFGYPACPWCIEALPILNEVAIEQQQNILYIRTRDDDKKLLYTEEERVKLFPYLKGYLNKDDEGNEKLFVPFVLVVKEGKVQSAHIGTVDSHDAHERKMNEDEKKELKKIFEDMLTKS